MFATPYGISIQNCRFEEPSFGMYVGKRICFNGGDVCTIRYIGEVKSTKGEWLGVEWDDPGRGKHDGQVGGHRYFQCASQESTAASFIRPTRPADQPRDFLSALRFKYASEHAGSILQIGQPPRDSAIRISGKEVEEVGFDKISRQLADLHELRIVLLDGLRIRSLPEEGLLRAWDEMPSKSGGRLLSDIHQICPKIIELDLSRNLFESFREVAAICAQLESLNTLRLDGNRFGQVSFSDTEKAHFKLIFAKVHNLSLESTLLPWRDVVQISNLFPGLKTLSISSNEFKSLEDDVELDQLESITTIILEANSFTSLFDLLPLHKLPHLRKLVLKLNSIAGVHAPDSSTTSMAYPALTELDLSYNAIASWKEFDALPSLFPHMTSLRISHNPLFTNLRNPAGKELTPDDGYMLTIARLPQLTTLNFSSITDKDRLNAESYYLSLIVQELSLAPESEAGRIKGSHPRWRQLCEEYGEPEIKREKEHLDPRSLAARCVSIDFELSASAAALFNRLEGSKAHVKYVPKRLNIYSVLGIMARAFGHTLVVSGLSLVLILEDWEEIDGEKVQRQIKLVPETRGIGTFIEERNGRVRVDYEDAPLDMASYKHPYDLENFLKSSISTAS